jgi:anti-anti-sigma regulatory factor
MLRITRIGSAEAAETVKLEGKLLGPWVDEVRQAVSQRVAEGSPVRLDLSALTFLDAAGTDLLRDLLQRKSVAITACSGFVAALLHVEKS